MLLRMLFMRVPDLAHGDSSGYVANQAA
jgi:hypothetical protein